MQILRPGVTNIIIIESVTLELFRDTLMQLRRHRNNLGWQWPDRATYLLLILSLSFPFVLVVHAVYAARELNEMRAIFLRERAANVASRLEVMPSGQVQRGDFAELLAEDSAVLRIRSFGAFSETSGNPKLEAVSSGRELYSTEEVHLGQDSIFRAYIPFHSGGAVKVAQIDLASDAPEYIVIHARRNVAMSIASGSVLLVLSLYGIWSVRRTARLELKRQEAERLAQLGRLSAALAHEIRNPLGTIKGFAQLAAEDAELRDRKPLEAILRETQRLEALVRSLLVYGRPVEPVVRPTRWAALAEDLTAYARNAIGDRAIRFTAASDVPDLVTDPDLLKQALLNLIRNSVESIPEGGAGNVSLRAAGAQDGSLVISVEDDGTGVPESVREKLFAPFVTTKAAGTGLGLAISKKLVETLGGSLRLLAVEPRGTKAELAFYGTNSGHR